MIYPSKKKHFSVWMSNILSRNLPIAGQCTNINLGDYKFFALLSVRREVVLCIYHPRVSHGGRKTRHLTANVVYTAASALQSNYKIIPVSRTEFCIKTEDDKRPTRSMFSK